MATYVLIHGAGDSAFAWDLVVPALRERGHDVVAIDLPCDDESAGLADYAEAVVAAIGDRTELVVVAHSFGAFTAPLVCARVPVELLVLVAAMIPRPGEAATDWSAGTSLATAARDDSDDSDDSEAALFYHDVPPALAAEALRRGRAQAAKPWREPWPLAAWPDVPTKVLLCRDDRVFPAASMRRIARDRLGIVADEIDGGHCVTLARPHELVERLEAYRAELQAPHRVRCADAFDAEARPHDARLHAAANIRPGERVLDLGCGTGLSTRAAAAAAAPGHVLGVNLALPLIEHARRLTAAVHLHNATYEAGDAQVHPFPAAYFDVVISRFGAMFFTDPPAAFANIARALRPGGRLALLVWQRRQDNEWAVELDRALGTAALPPPIFDPFSLGDPVATSHLLSRAGFVDIDLADVHEPVFYGRDVAAALTFVRGFQSTSPDPARADERLRAVLAAHLRADGVYFDARASIITATTV